MDERMPAVDLRELALVGRLEAIVELLGDTDADLLGGTSDVPAHFPCGQASNQSQEGGKQLRVLEVRAYRRRHAGVLDLYRHGATIVQTRCVHLANGGRREGLPVEFDEGALGSATQLTLEHLACEIASHRRRV